jgi:hypothetical protein
MSSKGWRKLKKANGIAGAGTVTRHDGIGLLSYGAQTDDGDWLFMLVTDDGRGAWATADTDGEAKRRTCDELGLNKGQVLGGVGRNRSGKPSTGQWR